MNLSRIEKMVREGDLSLDALKYLIDCRAECEWLDYKQVLQLDTDYQVASFGKDAIAMKNTGGGYLVIGVQDKTWLPQGLPVKLAFDAKLLRDKIRRATGLEITVDIVQHQLRYTGELKWFALILVRASSKRKKRRTPSMVRIDFCVKHPYGLRRGEIYFRRGDSTVRLDDGDELADLLDDLEDRADQDSLVPEQHTSPFAIDTGTYRLLEKDYRNFIGRQVLREKINEAITRDRRIWIVNVHGPGGVGKSALATQAAYDFYERQEFEAILHLTAKETVLTHQGIVRSLGRTLYSLEDLLAQILRLFGEEPRSEMEENKSHALEWLSVMPTLLVLDNLETVDDGRILSFIQGLPDDTLAKVLITSRRKTGGWEFPVTVSELNREEISEFIATKSSELGISIKWSEDNIDNIANASGGLPLAIQWILGHYKLSRNLNKSITAVNSDDSPVLEFSFRNIWDALDEGSRRVLSVMSIFDSPPDSRLLAIATNLPPERLEAALLELEEATLIGRQVNEVDRRSVYTSLPITLTFAAKQLPRFGNLEIEARRRVQQYVQQMDLQQWEVQRFVDIFKRYGVKTDNEKRGVILCRRGESATFAGNLVSAEELFTQARAVAPTSAYVFAMSANFELARKRVGQAIKYADNACARANRFTGALAYSVKARVSDAQRDKRGQIAALRRAIEYDPQDLVLRHQYGVALSRAGETRDAIEQFSRIISIEGAKETPSETLIMALKTRIINYRRLRYNEEAEEDLARAKDLLVKYPHLSSQAHHIADLE
ncbi:putative DNA binding domain-containing protein [Actinomadura barringtoniae]|uniref:DNA binding domain-containing protein n=1 Tax=Actinomadura barringtoniae TaxID=1427535 RepID=A0A939P7Q0_9ACTN|nr:RNA-binding domain-containing protein [Actinomadura barringtoniae]MBO2447133.1 putative DNA binding domain-containing protein [Actinomadura barringtoniae]